jgi:hypothetical protein
MCDHLLGQLLDYFDEHDLWKDTALVVTSDHGFLLGEHDFWAKNRMNLYEEVAHIPLFLHDPRHPERAGTRSGALTQSIDIAATFLDLFGAEPPPENEGFSLSGMADGTERRKGALFGYFGGAVNVTDGRHTYHRFPEDLSKQALYQYTLVPTHIFSPFTPAELADIELSPPLSFTKGASLLKVPVIDRSPMYNNYGPGSLLESETRLYDLATDPGQDAPLDDPELETAMTELMSGLMQANGAPPEAFTRLGLDIPAGVT